MNPLVAEYRALSRGNKHPPDQAADDRKVEIVRALDEDANQEDVSALLLDLLRDAAEFDPARAEAIEVVGLYIDESSPVWQELFREVLRIHADSTEDDRLRSAAEPYASFLEQTLEG